MSFQFNAPKSAARSERTSNVDYDLLNEAIFLATTAGKKKSIPGYVTGIYDLGIQNREDAEEEYNPTKSYPEGFSVYAEGGKDMVRYPRKPCRTVALAIDFPQYQVDYSLHCTGESAPVPYRMLLNGTWGVFDEKEGKKVQTVTGFPLTLMKDDNGSWGVAKNSKLHALAEACEVLDEKGRFLPENLGLLLGKVAQFQVEVSLTPSKDGSRKYLNERIKLAGVVPEGLPVPELDPSLIHGLNFFGANDPDMVKKIRKVVKGTVKRAIDYPDSDIKKVIDTIEASNGNPSPSSAKPPSPAPAPTPKPPAKATPTKAPTPVPAAAWEDGSDDESPF
jgi:hypothetical protein